MDPGNDRPLEPVLFFNFSLSPSCNTTLFRSRSSSFTNLHSIVSSFHSFRSFQSLFSASFHFHSARLDKRSLPSATYTRNHSNNLYSLFFYNRTIECVVQMHHQEQESHRLLDISHQDHPHHSHPDQELGRRSPSPSRDHVEFNSGQTTPHASPFVGQASSPMHHPISTNKYSKRAQDRTTKPSLWNTREFYFYYLVFLYCVPYMFKTAHDASSGKKTGTNQYFRPKLDLFICGPSIRWFQLV